MLCHVHVIFNLNVTFLFYCKTIFYFKFNSNLLSNAPIAEGCAQLFIVQVALFKIPVVAQQCISLHI